VGETDTGSDAAPAEDEVAIVRLTTLADWRARADDLDRIFFEASLTKTFADAAERHAFRERWLGRFLDLWPALTHVAVAGDGRLLGYIVGAADDPARDARFADIGFYRHFAHVTPGYPAHLHINLAPEARNLGLGSRLMRAFEADVRDAGLPGLHLVTGRDSRNRSFYARNGFREVAGLLWGGTPIVMLGKTVDR
jgi:ribosomal protein S18 acetylase RimI-like enzyme